MAKRFNSKAEFASKAEFDLVDNHRETISTSICQAAENLRSRLDPAAPSDLTACILSGGYGTDLSLPLLLNHFSKITLVGKDLALLKTAVALQGIEGSERLDLMGDLDLTGIGRSLEIYPQNNRRNDLSDLIRNARTASWNELPLQVDFNASVCFLSQLIMDLIEGVGEHHDQFVTLVQAVRLRHLQLMLEQLRPGGMGLLAFDFVSSDTLPALPSLSGEELERTLFAAIDHNNFFHGLNPQVFLNLFKKDLHDQISASQFSKPWVWKTAERSYAVTAVMFQKKSD